MAYRKLQPGTQIGNGRFYIIKWLGGGGFGATYLAEDKHDRNEKCAIKHFIFTSQKNDEFEKAQELFEREARVLKQLNNSNNLPQPSPIPKYIAYLDNSPDEHYLVEEFIEGTTLREEINKKEIKESEAIDLLKDVLEGLIFLHDEGFIHRDIKPDNLIRRNSDKRLIIIDFGGVKEKNYQVQSSVIVIGTPGYIPSEQEQGNTEHNSDIYALGMTVIEAIIGEHPQNFTTKKTGKINWPSSITIRTELRETLEKMVDKDNKRQRYQSAEEVLEDLNNLTKTLPVVVKTTSFSSVTTTIGKVIRSNPIRALIILIIFITMPFAVAFIAVNILKKPIEITEPIPSPSPTETPTPIESPTPIETPSPSPTPTPSIDPDCVGPFQPAKCAR